MDKEKYHRSYPAYSYGSYRYGHRDHARIQEGNPCRRTPDRIGWHRSDDRHHQHPDILPSRQSRHDAQRRSPKLQSVVGSVSLGERYSKTSHHHSVSLKEITSDTKQGRPELREPLITTRTREQTKSSASQNHKESPGTDVNKNVIVGRYSAGIQGLHEEIEAFYAEIHADGKEATRRQTVIQRITQIITAEFPGVKVDYFGSTLTGLFLHSSDIDLVAVVNILVDPAAWLRGCYLALQRHSEVRCTEQLTSAKVPVVKFVDVSTGIKVDLSCIPLYGYNQGVAKSQWIKSTISRYPLLPKLVIVVKEYLRRRNLHEIYHRGINSYVVSLMAISFFQHHATGNSLGSLLLRFFQVYGKEFDFDKHAIIVAGNGQIISKSDMQSKLGMRAISTSLSIQDPVEPAKDAAEPSRRGMDAVKRAFGEAHDALQRAVDSSVRAGDTVSFLDVIFDYYKHTLAGSAHFGRRCF